MTIIEKIAAARAARDPRCTDETGATWRTPEKRAHMDRVRAWKAAGRPDAEAKGIADERGRIRADGQY